MLTLEDFNNIEHGSVFASGVLPNSPEGLYMTDSHIGRDLKWLAKKGGGNDWAIYCHWDDRYSYEYVKKYGDKVVNKEHILKCVPCDEEMFNLYRY